jgi:hypothetical protein
MRTIIALCSMILLFSFTGVQAQTDAVPVAGDSLQTPSVSALPVQIPKIVGSLKGVYLVSCTGLYYYNKSTVVDYDWYSDETYNTTYKTYIYSVLLNGSYFVADGFSLGATTGVLTIISKSESDRTSYYDVGQTYSTSISIFGPRIAYYYGKRDSKMLPFAAFEYDILLFENYSDEAIRIGAGILLQPRPHLGISFGLDYLKFGEEEKSTNIIGVLGLTGIIY